MRRHLGGLTLVEMLVVLSILGLLLGLGIPNYFRMQRQAQLRLSVQSFTAQVDNARAEARRTGRCLRLQVTGGTTAAYTIAKSKSAVCTNSAANVERTVTYAAEPGTRITPVPAAEGVNVVTVDFRPPFGVNAGGLPLDLSIEHLTDASLKRDLRVTGVMGTVVVK